MPAGVGGLAHVLPSSAGSALAVALSILKEPGATPVRRFSSRQDPHESGLRLQRGLTKNSGRSRRPKPADNRNRTTPAWSPSRRRRLMGTGRDCPASNACRRFDASLAVAQRQGSSPERAFVGALKAYRKRAGPDRGAFCPCVLPLRILSWPLK